MLPCGALRVYVALRDARSCFDNAVRVRGFANLLVMAADSVDGLELWTVLLVKNVLCDRNVKVLHTSTFARSMVRSTYSMLPVPPNGLSAELKRPCGPTTIFSYGPCLIH